MRFHIPSKTRKEIKFVTNHYNYYKIINWVKMNSCNFITEYPNRWINSVYFDSYNYCSYQANLSGQSARTKLRYRWYGKKEYPFSGLLEIKNKRNYFGWKHKYAVKNPPYSKGDNWNAVIKNISSQLPPVASHILLSYSHPIIINRYERSYFRSFDKKIRLTVDRFQTVHDQRNKCFPEVSTKANLPETVVVEIKFDRNDHDLANNIMQTFPIRVSKHSKYMNALDAVSFNKN